MKKTIQLLQSKWREYLIELIVIIVGILLAIALNNWNENRKNRKAEFLALMDLRDEFITNRKNFQELISLKKELKQLWKDYLETIIDKDLPASQRAINRPHHGARSYVISNSTLNSLLNSGKIDNIENDSLKQLLSNWHNIIQAYQQVEKRHFEFSDRDLLPYERTLVVTEAKGLWDVEGTFYKEHEKKEILLKANEDFIYRNLLKSNYARLAIQIERSAQVKNYFNQIIQLMNEEIENKKK